jgi:hypothetical protein
MKRITREDLYVGMPLELEGHDRGIPVYVMAVEPWKHVKGLVHAPAKSKKTTSVAVAIDFRDSHRSELDWRPACVPLSKLYRPGETAVLFEEARAYREELRAKERANEERVAKLLRSSRLMRLRDYDRRAAGALFPEVSARGQWHVVMPTDLYEDLLALYYGLPKIDVESEDVDSDSALQKRCDRWNSLYPLLTPVIILTDEERWDTKTRSKAFVQQGRAVIYVRNMHDVVPLDNIFTHYHTRC